MSKYYMQNEKLLNRHLALVSCLLVLLSYLSFIEIDDGTLSIVKSLSSTTLNIVLVNLTALGDSFMVLAIIFLLNFFNRKKAAIQLFLGFLFTSIFIQLIKNYSGSSFAGFNLFWEANQYIITDIANYTETESVVSSHSAVVFLLTTFLAFHLKNPILLYGAFAVAVAVAYSRLYLSHNSFAGISVGIGVGSICGFFAIWIEKNKKQLKQLFFKRLQNKQHKNQQQKQQLI
jgi:membrane-associated phospholipid phosphatase